MSRIEWWSLSDEALSRQCVEDRYRASGPGGQKRNKTESAVRLRHLESGLIVTASESRSQHENRRRALRRMREALVFERRQPLADEPAPTWVIEACAAGRIGSGRRDERSLALAAYLLDALDAAKGRIAPLGGRLGISTAKLTAMLRANEICWRSAQNLRSRHGLGPLR